MTLFYCISQKNNLNLGGGEIENFLNNNLRIELHPEKSKIISLYKCIDFVGFLNFYHFKLLRKRSIRKMNYIIKLFSKKYITYCFLCESFQGWQAHARHADTYKLRKKFAIEIAKAKHNTSKDTTTPKTSSP
jgi:RNA-directed DNA polymerase